MRIAPMFWLSLAFYSLVPEVMPHFWLGRWAPTGVKPSYYLATALFVHGWYPYTFNSIVPGGWSIAVEMTFYLLCPLLFTWIDTPKRAALVALLCALMGQPLCGFIPRLVRSLVFPSVGDDSSFLFWQHLWFPNQLPVFMVGLFIFHLVSHPVVSSFVRDPVYAGVLFVASFGMLLSFLNGYSNYVPINTWITVALGGITVALSGGKLPFLVPWIVRHIGKLSYSCYLLHFAALGLALRVLHLKLTEEAPLHDFASRGVNFAYFAGLFGLTLIATLVTASFTGWLVEKPGVAAGRWLIIRLNLGASSCRS